ncbi:hypothetical protein ACLMJK_005200 [Lecanora helva]
MAWFGEHERDFILTDHPKDHRITLHQPSSTHPTTQFPVPYERPPSGPLDAMGLKDRIAFGNRIRKLRDITPRTMRFIQLWKKKAEELLRPGGRKRAKAAEEFEAIDGEIQSRYDLVHSDDGLIAKLVTSFNALAEVRLRIEYGDYLALAWRHLKSNDMGDMQWKVDNLDWQQVAARICEEESIMEEEEARCLKTRSATPYLTSVKEAAAGLGWDEGLVRYTIVEYAKRNNLCHSGIENMVEEGYFQQLAEKIVKDKRSLERIYYGKPQDQVMMRNAIGVFQNTWFEFIKVEEKKGGHVIQKPTKKQLDKLDRLQNRGLGI